MKKKVKADTAETQPEVKPNIVPEVPAKLVGQMAELLRLQNEANSSVNPDWIKEAYDFACATAVEGGELIESVAWKWWKAQEIEWANAKMEAVDMFHFLLSMVITVEKCQDEEGYNRVAPHLANIFYSSKWEIPVMDKRVIKECTKRVIYQTLKYDITREGSDLVGAFKEFDRMMFSLEMDTEDLFKLYVIKNRLNIFRQANGYKEGSYVKKWAKGKEDNDIVVEEIYQNGMNSDELYKAMEKYYSQNVV